MFYAHFVLAKKGPLARIWLAAHWDKKLTKAHVFDTNIEKSVDGILQPKVKMALRTSGHLLLGVVRIYSRKAKYLLADCNEAFVKIKMAFRPGMVDLPEEHREAAVNAITLPEMFHDFDTEMPDMAEDEADMGPQFSMNQTRAEEITMREDYGNINLETADDSFGDLPNMHESGDGPDEIARSGSLGESLLPESGSIFHEEPAVAAPQPSTSDHELSAPIQDDGFGGGAEPGDFGEGLFGEGGLFDEPAQVEPVVPELSARKSPDSDDDDHRMDDFAAPSPGGMSSVGGQTPRPDSPQAALTAPPPLPIDAPPTLDETPIIEDGVPPPQDQTTLVHNENESFALPPVDASAIRGFVRTKRKRKLVVDEVKAIAGEEMKAQLSDTGDIVTTLDLAPPTKRLMHWKETGGVEKLFALPGRPLNSKELFKSYQDHLSSSAAPNEVFGMLGDSETEGMQLEFVPGEDDELPPPRKPGRPPKRKKEKDDDGEKTKTTPTKKSSRVSERLQRVVPEPAAPPTPAPIPVVEEPPTPLPEAPPATPRSDPFQEPEAAEEVATLAPPGPEPFPDPASVPPAAAPGTPHPAAAGGELFENMGYDQTNPNMSNMGWEAEGQGAPTPGGPMSTGAPTPYRDDEEDYFNPASVGTNKGDDEMQENETIEEFEDRVLNKRAAHLNTILKSRFESQESMTFAEIPIRRLRKSKAQNFYSLLVLQKHMAIELQQEEQFTGDIFIRKGPKFETVVL
eukprot:maker-scaffold566_size135349-snap-gene-0.33 protein:Tk08889 transcript:maker-scaffold566_size135349-snap-gene-0.33-mRNA-1 annotation:"hypothetical protein SINV_03308"